MCLVSDRRTFIKNISLVVAGSQLGVPFSAVANILSPSATLAKLTTNCALDSCDRHSQYIRDFDMTDWHAEIHPLLRTVVPQALRATQGQIVELGTYEGKSYRVLREVFGDSHITTLDIHQYYFDTYDLVIGDIRGNVLHDRPIKIGWNDIGSWANSPRSRLAAFNFVRRNLVRGGLYIDGNRAEMPADLDLSGFTLVHRTLHASIFRRS